MLVKSKPIFLFLLPVFFVLHGFMAKFDSVPVPGALLLTAEYILASLVLTAILWLLFRELKKASLMTIVIMAFQFFFGDVFDILKNIFPNSIISQYRFIIPFSLLLFILIFILLKRTRKSLSKLMLYLNLLLLVFILVDAMRLALKISDDNKRNKVDLAKESAKIWDSCSKPDIFLIVPDQYSGSIALKNVFQFDNSAFENELRSRGFHVIGQSISNYNLTPFSMASLLNMDFLNLKNGKQNFNSVNQSYRTLRKSEVIKLLTKSGYEFYNCSIFDFERKPAYKYKAFLPYGIKLITAQTFTDRIIDDFRQDVLSGKFNLKDLRKKIAYENLHFNDEMISQTGLIAARKNGRPKFVYTHLMMPHYPYYFDSSSKPLPVEKMARQSTADPKDYLSYLVYTNRKLLSLIDKILTSSKIPPVIILLSDHGLQKIGDRKYDFYNLNAVNLPGKDYQQFYDGISNVNEFRIIFNKLFNQQSPLLKDSTINVWD